MTTPAGPALAQALVELLQPAGLPRPHPGEVLMEPLPSSRRVCRFTFPGGQPQVVGKFFSAHPPEAAQDRSLAQEYENYRQAPGLGLNHDSRLIPRLLGRRPELCLGLLLTAIPGPNLDQLLELACLHGQAAPLSGALESLARLLAFFHSRPIPPTPVFPAPALEYLEKVIGQLWDLGLLTQEDRRGLEAELAAWQSSLASLPDQQVLVHGDATPTNFLFPDGQAVALDLERLRPGDRLWDLSWVSGELKHAWAWRTGDLQGAEGFIRFFFAAYLAALPGGTAAAARLFRLNPLFMAMAELRIARNAYLAWDYRRELVAESRRCLAAGRSL